MRLARNRIRAGWFRGRRPLGGLPGALLAMLVVLAGCGAQFDGRAGSAHPNPEHERWVDYYLLGLVGEDEVDLRYYCRHGALRIERGATFGTLALSVVTVGIYTPRKMWLTCVPARRP